MVSLAPSLPRAPRFIEIAFCCDDAYVQPLTAAIASVIATAQEPHRLRFWLLSKTLREPAIRNLRVHIEASGACLMLQDVSGANRSFQGVPLHGHLSEAGYYRLLLPEMLPADCERVLYLDCDLIVCRPVEELWSVDLQGRSTAAVQKPRAENFRSVGLRSEEEYFNSGVMLLDLVRWRRDRLHEQALTYALRHPRLQFHDQDALNAVIQGHWHRLDPRWNQQFRIFKFNSGYLHLPAHELQRLRRDPFIVHYTTASKPWHFDNDHPLRDRYFEALDRTHYRGWRPPVPGLRKWLRRATRQILPHHLRPKVMRQMYRPHFHALLAFLHL